MERFIDQEATYIESKTTSDEMYNKDTKSDSICLSKYEDSSNI